MMSVLRAALCAALLLMAQVARQPANAADKVVAGSLGGQAPLWAIYVAVHKGFFKAEGLDLELIFAQSGAAVTQQLTAGSLDVALSVGITDPIHAIDKGASLAMIRIVGQSAPYVLVGKPELKSITDLKGKTISVGADKDVITIYFERMMAAHGLKKGEYTTLPAGVAAARFAAVKAGVADAAMVLPPLNFVAADAGFSLLGYAADYVKNVPFTGMAVNLRWAATHADAVKRVLAATDKSVAWLNDTTHRAEAVELLVKFARARQPDAEASYDFLKRISYFEPSSKVSRKKLQNLIEIERTAGNVGPGLTVDKLVSPQLTELVE